MSVFYYYGQLRDITTATAEIDDPNMYVAQYPMSNINYLNKNVYSELDYGDTDTASVENTIVFFYGEYSSVQDASSFVYDFNNLTFLVENSDANDIEAWEILLQGRATGGATAWTTIETITLAKGGASGATGDAITTILDGTETYTFSEISYLQYRLALHYTTTGSTDVSWDIDGKINNLYIGDYLTMPCPELQPEEWQHQVNMSTSFAGFRNAVRNQPQRDVFTNSFIDLSSAQKASTKLFDAVAGEGAIPVYYEDTTDSVIMFARVTNRIRTQEKTTDLYSLTQIVEEEL